MNCLTSSSKELKKFDYCIAFQHLVSQVYLRELRISKQGTQRSRKE